MLAYPAIGGPELRILNSIRALSRISDLHVISRRSADALGGELAEQFFKKHCVEFAYAPSAIRRSFITRLIRKTHEVVHAKTGVGQSRIRWDDSRVRDDSRFILNHANRIGADIIWLGYGNISYPLLRYLKEDSKIRVVIDTDSVWSRFILRGLPFAESAEQAAQIQAEGDAKADEERWGVELADITTAVSEIDADYYRTLSHDHEKIKLFSNVVDLEDYVDAVETSDMKPPQRIYLAGTFWENSPMQDAAEWTINEILPLVKRVFPEVVLQIVGRGSQHTLRHITDPSVKLLGQVDSVIPFLKDSSAVLVPLRFESGTRFKILEAGACSKAVVSTTLGAEGIPVTDGEDILIADQPQEFADAIIRILKDHSTAKSMGLALNRLVERHFSISSLASQGQAICSQILRDPPHPIRSESVSDVNRIR